MDKRVKEVAGVAEQHGHKVPYHSPHREQARQDIAQNAQHNRDLQRIEKLHRRGSER